MPRRTDNLERLCHKLERRFGSVDPLFLNAKTELDGYKATRQFQRVQHDWSKPYSVFIKSFDAKGADNPVAEKL